MCNCGSGIESTAHFLLHCPNYNIQRQTLFDNIATIDDNILNENENTLANILLFGKQNIEDCLNKRILNATIQFILTTLRFENPLF